MMSTVSVCAITEAARCKMRSKTHCMAGEIGGANEPSVGCEMREMATISALKPVGHLGHEIPNKRGDDAHGGVLQLGDDVALRDTLLALPPPP